MKSSCTCLECGNPISDGFFAFSTQVYGFPLCMQHLFLIEEQEVPQHTLQLYFALKNKQFPVMLDFMDNGRPVAIALPGQLIIEIHSRNTDWLVRELTTSAKTVYPVGKKIPTILISDKMLRDPNRFERAVEELSKACRVMQNQSVLYSLARSVAAVQLQ